jgi:hypothetical protein
MVSVHALHVGLRFLSLKNVPSIEVGLAHRQLLAPAKDRSFPKSGAAVKPPFFRSDLLGIFRRFGVWI